MRRSTCCVLVELFGSWLSSFGQSAPKFTTPQIVATFQRLNQTGEIPPTTIYTPKNCGTFRKCQSKHTVDRLNLQPAVRSGQITAGLARYPWLRSPVVRRFAGIYLAQLRTRGASRPQTPTGKAFWGLTQPSESSAATSREEVSIDDQVNLRVGEFFSSRHEYCYFHLIVGEAAGV